MNEQIANPPFTIVLAEDIAFDNFVVLNELLISAFAYMHDRIDPPSSMNQLTVGGLREKAQRESLILAFRDRQLIGCAFARPKTTVKATAKTTVNTRASTEATVDAYYIGKVAVLAACRGLGVGRKLLERAAQVALGNSCSVLELEIRIELVENHNYFEQLGFIKSGENAHQGYDRPTSFTYRKYLSQS